MMIRQIGEIASEGKEKPDVALFFGRERCGLFPSRLLKCAVRKAQNSSGRVE